MNQSIDSVKFPNLTDFSTRNIPSTTKSMLSKSINFKDKIKSRPSSGNPEKILSQRLQQIKEDLNKFNPMAP